MSLFKTKVAHILDNGDKIEFETTIEATSFNNAHDKAKDAFINVIKSLASQDSLDIDKAKIEMGMAHHH